jgi:hypothetical protein
MKYMLFFSFHGILKETHDRIEASGFQPPRPKTSEMEPPNIISNHQIIHSCPFSTA